MSRTKHHRTQKNQHSGEDLWSRRANTGGHYMYSAIGKRLSLAKERAMEKQQLIAELGDDADGKALQI